MALHEKKHYSHAHLDAFSAPDKAFFNLPSFLDYLKKEKVDFSRFSTFLEIFSMNTEIDNIKAVNGILTNEKNINEVLLILNQELKNSNKIAIGIVETTDDWKQKKRSLKIPLLKWFIRFWSFVFYRFLPKQSFFQLLTANSTKRLYSKAEILGRFIYSGFEIIDFTPLEEGYHLFTVKRISEPKTTKTSEGFILKMNRIGKNGKLFKVYKIRTMHPYSEYLHDYMIKHHGFNEKGKIKNDFRMAKWGKVLRKYWLDEIPQILNVFKGQMKLVGVRPVSQSYFNSLPVDIQQKRLTQKPGCIPPYVAHEYGTTKENVLQAELKYLEDKIQNPYSTDFRYFFIALYKIIFKGKRSS